MRVGLFLIYIFVNTFSFYAEADSKVTVPLYSKSEQNRINKEIEDWENEKLNGTFAYYTVNQNIAPTAHNGKRYRIAKGVKFRVYGKPKINRKGLAVIQYRSPDVPGCFKKTCETGVPPEYLKQISGYAPGQINQALDMLTGTLWSAGSDVPKCTNCSTPGSPAKPKSTPIDLKSTPAKVHIGPNPGGAKALDKTFAWLKNHLRCNNYEFMLTQRQDLLDAEAVFNVPAPFLACLIARESRWNIYADQLNPSTGGYGSYKGLAQANSDTLETERNYLNTDNKQIYRRLARQQWNKYMSNAPISRMTPEHMYKKTGKYSTGRYWDQCGTSATAAEKEKIGRASIAFVATYTNRIIDREASFIKKTKGNDAAITYLKTKRTKYFAAAIGYNAGPGYVDDMMPEAAYYTDSNAWMSKIAPPPYEDERRKSLGCSPGAIKNANAKKLQVIKPKKGKPYKPNPRNIRCTTEWISANVQGARNSALDKRGETRPYVKWIDVCMRGNQSELPPAKEKDGKSRLEAKNNGCGASTPLKACPPPKPKPKPKPKPAAKKAAAPAPAKGKKK